MESIYRHWHQLGNKPKKSVLIPSFIADVHLGKLARWLRMGGFDVLYQSCFTPLEIATLARKDQRVVLSKATSFAKLYPDVDVYIIESSDPLQQCRQVIHHYRLADSFKAFSRCLVCNHPLQSVLKENSMSLLPQQTSLYYNEFWQCTNCKRVYWKGPHYDRMLTLLPQLRKE